MPLGILDFTAVTRGRPPDWGNIQPDRSKSFDMHWMYKGLRERDRAPRATWAATAQFVSLGFLSNEV